MDLKSDYGNVSSTRELQNTARSITENLSDSQLETLCAALGWQGGTYWQVVDEVRRIVTELERLQHQANNDICTITELKEKFAKEWLSIDTAPRTGEWVLLKGGECFRDESDYDYRPVVAQWTDYLNGKSGPGFERWQFAWYSGGYFGEYKNPTHWMRL